VTLPLFLPPADSSAASPSSTGYSSISNGNGKGSSSNGNGKDSSSNGNNALVVARAPLKRFMPAVRATAAEVAQGLSEVRGTAAGDGAASSSGAASGKAPGQKAFYGSADLNTEVISDRPAEVGRLRPRTASSKRPRRAWSSASCAIHANRASIAGLKMTTALPSGPSTLGLSFQCSVFSCGS
jgi:hypothetical protein